MTIATAMEQLCFVEDLLAKMSQIRSGACEVAGMSKQRFIERLSWIRCLLRFNVHNVAQKRTYERVIHALELLKLDDSNGKIRKQPYCILLTGLPGCGKSRFALQLAIACLKSKYGNAFPSDLVTLNETDEFQSEFRTNHKVVIFDDLGAERLTMCTKNPWRKVIDFVNNVRKTSLNPNVEMKGNVYIEPDLVIITTNLSGGMGIASWMNAKGAILRRLSKVIYLERGFVKGGFITVEPTTRVSNLIYDTEFNIQAPCDRPNDNYGQKELISRDIIVEQVTNDFLKHIHKQEAFVSETNSLFSKVEEITPLKAFYNDMVYPILPKKDRLPPGMDRSLSWAHQFCRMFCVTDVTQPLPAIAQGGALCLPVDEVNREKSRFDVLQVENDDMYSREKEYVPQSACTSVDQMSDYKLIRFLTDRVDWPYYALAIRPIVLREPLKRFIVAEDCFYCDYRRITWKMLPKGDPDSGIHCDGNTLERAYELWLCEKEFSTPKILYNMKMLTEVNNSTPSTNNLDDLLDIDPIIDLDRCNLSKELDDNMENVILSRPPIVKYVAREYSIQRKAMDLLFTVTIEGKKVYFITEVKKNKPIKLALNQANVYYGSFKREHGNKLFCVLLGFTSEECSMKIIQADTKNQRLRSIIPKLNIVWDNWSKNYLDRCGAVELETDGDDLSHYSGSSSGVRAP